MLPRKLVQIHLLVVAQGKVMIGNSVVCMNVNMWSSSCNVTLFCRFALSTFFALNPELKVVAPWREWDITGREDASMQRNIMYLFQFQRNQYTAEIRTCGTLVMRIFCLFLLIF
jgi:argininosuccinate synthase